MTKLLRGFDKTFGRYVEGTDTLRKYPSKHFGHVKRLTEYCSMVGNIMIILTILTKLAADMAYPPREVGTASI